MRFSLIFSCIFAFLISIAPTFAQTAPSAMPGYLVAREGDAAAPLQFKKMKTAFQWENDDFAYASDWPSEGALLVALPEIKNELMQEENLFGDFKNGFGGELAVKDGNNDGIINSDEMVWPLLALWSDKNNDGYPQTDELEKLSVDSKAFIDRTKDQMVFNGKTYNFHAFLPLYDKINSRFVGQYILDIDTLFLPTMRGYGAIPDLHVSASQNESLKNDLIKFCQRRPKEIFSKAYTNRLEGEFANIMFKWSGVDTIDHKSRGGDFDARKLALLEKMLGEKYEGRDFGSNPSGHAVYPLIKAWNLLAGRSYSIITAQCVGRQIFVPAIQYDLSTDSVKFDARMATLQTRANIDNILAEMIVEERELFWLSFSDFLRQLNPMDPKNAEELIAALKGPPSMLTEVPRKKE